MPNRYEREIEEILRNLETPESRSSAGQKFGDRVRRKSEYQVPRRGRNVPSINLSVAEWLLLAAIAAALIGGGYAYANKLPTPVSGIIALVGFVCLVLVAFSSFIFQSRRASRPTARYGNVTPLRRGPFTDLGTRWHLFWLRLRYRNKNDR